MTNNIALDVFIGLIAIYLLYSLFASILMETISKYLALRARITLKAIYKLLDDSNHTEDGVMCRIWKSFDNNRFLNPLKDKPLTALFYAHPNIKNLGKSNFNRKPSSVTPEMFADTLIQILRGDEFIGQQNQIDLIKLNLRINAEKSKPTLKIPLYYEQSNYNPVGNNILIDANNTKLLEINSQTYYQLRQLLFESHSDIDWFKKKLMTWYNEVMDRAEGWYIKQTRTILFIIGFALALAFNIDTIGIAKKLSLDKTARDKMIEFASNISKDVNYKGSLIQKQSDTALKNALVQVNKSLQEYRSIIGPPLDNDGKCQKFFGFLITAFAISLGASFWFDLLGKIMCIRQGGNNSSTDKQKKPGNITNPVEEAVA